MSNTKKIIWFSQGAIGDALMMASLFEYVLTQNPDTEIIIITNQNKHLIAEIFKCYKKIDIQDINFRSISFFTNNIYIFPPTFGMHPKKYKLLSFLVSLNAKNKIVSFKDKDGKGLGKINLDFDKDILFIKNLEKILPYLNLEKPKSIMVPKLPVDPTFRNLYLKNLKYLVIHPFAANPIRSLPAHRWKKILKYININFPNITIVITGSKKDSGLAEQLIEGNRAISLAGKTSFPELVDIIKNSTVFLGVDTGITHLASVLKKKVILIGNLSNPTWLPYYSEETSVLFNDKNCSCVGDKSGECYVWENDQKYYRCMYEITDEAIENALVKKLT